MDTITITINDSNLPTRFHGDYVLAYLKAEDVNDGHYLSLSTSKQWEYIVKKMLIQKPKNTPDNIQEFPIPIYLQLTQKIAEMLGVTKELQKQCLQTLTQSSKFVV